MTKRREFGAQFKLETVLEGLRGERSIAQLCRERNITDSLYYKWRDEFLAGAVVYSVINDGETGMRTRSGLQNWNDWLGG